jgi:hypothetical protein
MKRRDWLLLFAAYEGAPDGLDPIRFQKGLFLFAKRARATELGSAKPKMDVQPGRSSFSELVDPIGRSRRAKVRMIYAAALELVGEPLSWSSVRNCLASNVNRTSPRFERVGGGQYRIALDAKSR